MILQHIIWDDFGCLEPSESTWLNEEPFWEDYIEAFFRSNGLEYDAGKHSNIHQWLVANDRAPFASMANVLVTRLMAVTDLRDTDLILLAHWLPDVHLGTSVTNSVMHLLGLESAFGFAISDRGVSAPFFALDCIERFLQNGKRRAILLTMDQRNLLYKSALLDNLEPLNCACVLVLSNASSNGTVYLGYRRQINVTHENLSDRVLLMMRELGLDCNNTKLVTSAPGILSLPCSSPIIQANPRRVCAAPFIAFAEDARTTAPGQSYLLLSLVDECLTGVGFRKGDE